MEVIFKDIKYVYCSVPTKSDIVYEPALLTL